MNASRAGGHIERRLIIEQFDPFRPKAGGIDTCIRGMIKYAPSTTHLWVAGVDAVGNKELGRWSDVAIDGRSIRFMPVVRLNHANLRRRVPHSLRLMTRFVAMREQEVQFDVVQTHRVNSGLIAALRYRRAKKVMLIHSSGTANLRAGSKSFFRWIPAMYRVFETVSVRHADKVVVFSRDGADRLRQKFSNVVFSPTWFDDDRFPVKSRLSSKPSKILWACRVEPAKNPDLAIHAFALMPEGFTLTVAGDGTLATKMKQLTDDLGLSGRVQFLGEVPKQQMGDLMRSHDFLLMTSLFEGFSRSIVEALASGLPVLTTSGGDPNGLIVDGVNGGRFERAEDAPGALARSQPIRADACRESVSHLYASTIVAEVFS